jgi:hypothetical protein
MMNKEISSNISEAIHIARELNGLLHEDALHRLRLYKEYSRETESPKWNPNLYLRCQLAEALCRKLENLAN